MLATLITLQVHPGQRLCFLQKWSERGSGKELCNLVKRSEKFPPVIRARSFKGARSAVLSTELKSGLYGK